jgi:hypothetical protein
MPMRPSLAAAAVAVLLLAGSPPVALAAHTKVSPPGNAGAGEYLENVPSAKGAQSVPNVVALRPQPQVLTPVVSHKLDASGKSGRRTAALAEATAPSGHTQQKAVREFSRLFRAQRADVVAGVADSLTGAGGGLSVIMPLLLAAIVLAALALALRRRGSDS